jgi:chemotaxis protein methyltransferase CheR
MFDFSKEKENIPFLIKYIEDICSISIGPDKIYLLEARLAPLITRSGVKTIPTFLSLARSDPSGCLRDKIIDAITTNETLWFRGERPWAAMENVLFPIYSHLLTSGSRDRIRILCAACATGQEPYSLAMLLAEAAEKGTLHGLAPSSFDITAFDISPAALAQAKAGRYNQLEIKRGLPDSLRDKYFSLQLNGDWVLDNKIRSMVRFQRFNLQHDLSPLGAFDLVLCRNALIYFREEFKLHLIERLARIILPYGFLLLGGPESLFSHRDLFIPTTLGSVTFYKRVGRETLNSNTL